MSFKVRVVPDTDAPLCPECHYAWTTVIVRSWLTTVEPPMLINEDQVHWASGLAQYNLSPGWLTGLADGFGIIELVCPECAYTTSALDVQTQPSGVRPDATVTMHGKL